MNPLQSRLAELRRRLRRVVTFRGGCWALAALVGLLTLACLIDLFTYAQFNRDLPGLIRAVFLVGTLGGTAGIAWFFLLRPMWMRTDDLSLALRVEKEYPILNDSLASTVQFLEQTSGTAPGVSATLQREAVGRALRLAQGCDFNKAVDSRGATPAFLTLLAACAVLVPLVLLSPGLAATSLVRLADPFGAHLWPGHGQQVVLTIDYPPRIGYGQKFVIRGTVKSKDPKKFPKDAVIEFQGLTPSPKSVAIVPTREDDDGKAGTLTAPIDMTQQRRDFRFRVRAGVDGVSPKDGGWHEVQLRHPPRLAPLNGKPSPQVVLTFPKYTDLQSPLKLAPGSGNIEGIAGTRVHLRAATDRPVARVWVEHRPVAPFTAEATRLGLLGTTHPVQAVALAAGGHAVWGRTYATVAPGGKEFTLDFQPWTLGTYQLSLEDAEGLAGVYEFDEHIKADPVPVVSIVQPAGSQSVLPNAEITVRVLAEDEVYAVRSVYLEYVRKGADGQILDAVPRRVPVYDDASAGAAIPQVLAALSGAPVPVVGPSLRLRPKRLQVARRWSLAGLVDKDETLLVQACAHDFNDVAAFNVPGRSPVLELRVVTKPALIAEIDGAQVKLQQELIRLREQQKLAIEKALGPEQEWRATGKLRPEDAVALAEAEQLQKEIEERVGRKADEGLRGELARLQEQLRDNKMPNSAAGERLQAVKEELDRLAREHLPEIEPRLTTARKELENKDKANPPGPKEKGPLGEARAHQDEVKRTLDSLLKSLEDFAPVQQVRGELRDILDRQRQLQKDSEALELQTRKLPPNEKWPRDPQAARLRIAARQRALADDTQKLLDKMKRMAGERALKDPAGAEMLEKAADLGDDFFDVGEKVKELAKDLERLQKDVQAAEKIADPKKRQEAFKRLAEEQRVLEQRKDDKNPGLRQKARDVQKAVGERMPNAKAAVNQMEEKIDQALDRLKRGESPEERLEEAREEIKPIQDRADKGHMLVPEMRNSAERIHDPTGERKAPELNKAIDQQGESIKALERMVEAMEQGRDADVARLLKRQQQQGQDMKKLADDLERLQKKVKAANELKDPDERKKALKELAEEQRRLQEEAEKEARELKRLQAPQAGKAMDDAGQQMGRAAKKLGDGEDPEEELKDAHKRVQEAQEQLDQAQAKTEEELAREQLARLADRIKGLKERQDAAIGESGRLHKAMLQNGKWTLGLRGSLLNSMEAQQGLAKETGSLKDKLKGAAVFELILDKTVKAMDGAAKTIGERKDKAALRQKDALEKEELADEERAQKQTLKLQQEASRRLQRLMDAVKPEPNVAQKPKKKDGKQPDKQAGGKQPDKQAGGKGLPGDNIPPLAQLKALRAEQQEVNDRTRELAREHPNLENLPAPVRAELDALQQDQARLLELFQKMAAAANGGGMP